MQILYFVLMILSGLFGITIGTLGVVVGLVAMADEDWAWIITAAGFAYLLHPALVYWLYKKTYETLAIGLSSVFMLCSIALTFLM